jgi:hypothetical protein
LQVVAQVARNRRDEIRTIGQVVLASRAVVARQVLTGVNAPGGISADCFPILKPMPHKENGQPSLEGCPFFSVVLRPMGPGLFFLSAP